MSVRVFDGTWPTLHATAYVDPQAAVIGQVTLGRNVSVWPFASLRGDLLPIRIGQYSNVQDNAVMHTTQVSPFNPTGFALTIGEYVTVGHGAILHGCTVGNHVLIGMGSIILDGVVIEDNVIVGSGCVVPPGKRLTSGFLYLGTPAKQARPLQDQEIAFMRWNAEKYVETKEKYQQQPPLNLEDAQ